MPCPYSIRGVLRFKFDERAPLEQRFLCNSESGNLCEIGVNL
jgi:hypothetical protein